MEKHLARLLVGSLIVLSIATVLVGPGNIGGLIGLFLLCIPFSAGLVNLIVLTVAYFLGWMVIEIVRGARATLTHQGQA